tara:strand:- start:210 stop:401 length:192 start_codon:yes stop_codon:yes gene_type:complete
MNLMKWVTTIKNMPKDDQGIPTIDGLANLLTLIVDAMGFKPGDSKRSDLLDRLGMAAATKVKR